MTLGSVLERRHVAGGVAVDYDRFITRLAVEGVTFPMVNPPAHGRALRCHDLHHALTGYGADVLGELELSAWELGGGCGRYVAALGFDLAGAALGMVVAPNRTLRAYARGRRSSNLFRRGFERALLDRSIESVRRELGIDDRDVEPTRADVATLALWMTVGLPWIALAPLSAVVLALTCFAPPPRER